MATKDFIRKISGITETKAYHRVHHAAHGSYLAFAVVHYDGALMIAACVALVVVTVSFIKGEAE